MDLFSRQQDVARFAALPPEVFRRIAEVLTPANHPGFWERQVRDLHEAMRLLAARISGLGLAPEMRDRSSGHSIARSPFYELVRRTEDLITHAETSESAACLDSWKQNVARCRQELETVYTHMETAGISVELIFDLQTIQACLMRMEQITAVLTAVDSHVKLAALHGLLSRLEHGSLEDKRISSLLRENLNLLARKVVDRTGDTGEHYIANSKAEYKWMWRAALGGGLLTVFTAALKMRIVDSHLPLFFEGFAAGTNYAVSFILLQVFGLVLATKQPATTAAAFARIIRDNPGTERSSKLADFVAHITSTQLAAALGNVFAVTIGAVVFEWLWRMAFHDSYLARESAKHVYETLHPFDSGTAFYAIITGVILWLAALAGSWLENAAVYYRFAEAIAQHPFGLRLSETGTRKLARMVRHNIGGWSTSIVLGYLLGFTPVLGAFFGFPLDVRHVTLSTGTLALAAARSGIASLSDLWFLYAVEGIGIVFVLNLTVSFLIALYVALRAYDIGAREQLKILWSVVVSAARSPLRFIVPQFPAATNEASAARASH
jgi:site-specific recombinase